MLLYCTYRSIDLSNFNLILYTMLKYGTIKALDALHLTHFLVLHRASAQMPFKIPANVESCT